MTPPQLFMKDHCR